MMILCSYTFTCGLTRMSTVVRPVFVPTVSWSYVESGTARNMENVPETSLPGAFLTLTLNHKPEKY